MKYSVTAQLKQELKRSCKNGLSLYRIAKMIGKTDVLLYRFMAGQGGLSLRVVEEICKVLELDLVKRKGAHD